MYIIFLYYNISLIFNYNLLLFLKLIYCILLYGCALEHVNFLIERYPKLYINKSNFLKLTISRFARAIFSISL